CSPFGVSAPSSASIEDSTPFWICKYRPLSQSPYNDREQPHLGCATHSLQGCRAMRRIFTRLGIATALGLTTRLLDGQAPKAIPLDVSTKLQVVNARVIPMEYRGRQALKLAPLQGHEHDTDQE